MPFSHASESKLFQPFQLGNIHLEHRVVLAPLTRFRANAAHVLGDLSLEYCKTISRNHSTASFAQSNAQMLNAPAFPEHF